MSDLILIPSVVDVAGLNTVSRAVLLHAAHAVAGMCSHGVDPCGVDEGGGRTVGITMFGVTTPCVTEVRNRLEASGWEALVFHATGTGGRTMEKLAGDGMIHALLDLTTTEVADEVVGGVFPSGKTRFDLLAREPIPCVMSLGALDMVNFGHRDTVPPQFRSRTLCEHNAQVTLMRTTADECRAIAQWMAEKINRSRGPLTLLIPEKGLSAIDTPGHSFHDPDADAALFEQLRKRVCVSATRQVISLPLGINDPGFAEAAFNELQALSQTAPSSS